MPCTIEPISVTVKNFLRVNMKNLEYYALLAIFIACLIDTIINNPFYILVIVLSIASTPFLVAISFVLKK